MFSIHRQPAAVVCFKAGTEYYPPAHRDALLATFPPRPDSLCRDGVIVTAAAPDPLNWRHLILKAGGKKNFRDVL